MASWFLVMSLSIQYPRLKVLFYYALLFFPSVVFWSSGILKDSIACATLFLIVAVALRSYWKIALAWWHWLFAAVGLVILIQIKFYAAGVLIICLVVLLAEKLLQRSSAVLRWSSYGIVLVIGALMMSCLLYTSPSPRDRTRSRMPSSA